MEIPGLYNILAVVTGIAIATTCCLISYLFQIKLFNKYHGKIRNEIDKARSEPPVFPNEKV